ncbi:thioesterase II family protein [Streptomyces lavendofoliae]|uniref:thioesterase II family protein n=1 Tax=Streptomyces lavendofoliae TaxID=67314 RepID=UPI003D8E2689
MTTRLLCLPYAGAGAGVYRPWYITESPLLNACPIQVPGREEEFTEPFYADMAEASAATADRFRSTAGTEPYLVFGHSFGAVLAYEAVRHLADTGGPLPQRLVVSGSVSPRHRMTGRLSEDDERAVEEVRELVGRDVEAFHYPELRALLLPVMRADVALLADYAPGAVRALPVPITAFRGTDDARVPVPQWEDWASYTSSTFDSAQFAGGHMYLTECWPVLWKTIEGLL